MPGIESWLTCPLAIVQRLFDEDATDHDNKLKEYFLPKIEASQTSGLLPSLNDVPTHLLATNSMVQFRCMVQDMLDPEFYLGIYEVESLKTGAKCLRSGKYRDLAECGPCEEIKLDSPRNVTMDRNTFYCVPVPGESDWVKEIYAKNTIRDLHNTSPSTSVTSEQVKRSLDEVSDPTETCSNQEEIETMETDSVVAETKKTKIDRPVEGEIRKEFDLNFPLPDEKGTACIVKVYQSDESIKLNDVIEVIGILSNHPAMASFSDGKQSEESAALLDPSSDIIEETSTSAPPPSLVPRLHAIRIQKLQHNNPFLSPSSSGTVLQGDAVLAEAGALRDQLMTILTQLLAGDHIAAEYLLCHLVSSVYARHDVAAVGKFALNLSGCPVGVSFPQLLHGFIKELVTKCYFLPLSLENMNKLSLIPKKDYKENRLKSGVLQLSNGTHLILDETALQPGQLDTNGVSNMTALGNMISWQRLDYDFSFHKQEFMTDIITLVLSEGKSILKCDCQVPLMPGQGGFPGDLKAHFNEILSRELSCTEKINKLRAYITTVQMLPYEVPSELQKVIEEDFVNARKENSRNMSVDDFHSLLLLSRLLSLTCGQKTLTQETWNRAKLLEIERKTRLVLTSADQSR